MALQLGALRDALIDAGASEEKAQRPAEDLAGYDNRLAGIDARLAGIDARLTGVDARLTMLTWTVGVNVAVCLAALGSLFALWSKVGELGGQVALLARAVSH
jgi:hypothetical protein